MTIPGGYKFGNVISKFADPLIKCNAGVDFYGSRVFRSSQVIRESHLTISIRPGACRTNRLPHLDGAHNDILRKDR